MHLQYLSVVTWFSYIFKTIKKQQTNGNSFDGTSVRMSGRWMCLAGATATEWVEA